MERPNLLIIHTDQQSTWSISSYGGTLVQTPHTDRIGAEGAIFTQFFANTAFCTPSRGCMLTGRYPHAHGAYINNVPLNRDEITIAEVLKRQGYSTGYSGKWHLDGMRRPGWLHEDRSMGFDDSRYMFNRGHFKKINDFPMGDMTPELYPYSQVGDESTYMTDWLTGKTIDFIEAQTDDPFCYMVSFPDPHPPVSCRAPYDTMYKPEEMPIPETFSEQNLPDWAEEARSAGPFALDKPDREERLKEKTASYCGEVKLIDDCVGRILDRLAQLNILDKTVVVFTTDHGEYMGEHGLQEKNQLYETAYHLPLLVRWPGAVPAGTRVERVLSTVDFQPTILGLMGVAPSGREQGHDASPFLRGEDRAWADEAMLHHCTHERAGIFTPSYELALVHRRDSILFDRENDPLQMNNLFSDPAHREVREELTRKVVMHHVETNSPAANWLREM